MPEAQTQEGPRKPMIETKETTRRKGPGFLIRASAPIVSGGGAAVAFIDFANSLPKAELARGQINVEASSKTPTEASESFRESWNKRLKRFINIAPFLAPAVTIIVNTPPIASAISEGRYNEAMIRGAIDAASFVPLAVKLVREGRRGRM